MSETCPDCHSGFYHGGTPTGKTILLKVPASVDGGTLECYVATPTEPATNAPVMLFLTDIFGMRFINSQLLADTYAAAGITVYVPNILGTHSDGSPDAVMASALSGMDELASTFLAKVWKGLKFVAAIPSILPFFLRHGIAVTAPRVQAAANAVRALVPAGSPIVCAGFCFGGGYALRLGCGPAPAVDAVIATHPSGISVPKDAEMLLRPTLFCLAPADFAFNDSAIANFKETIEKRTDADAPPCKWNLYTGEGITHGFAVRGGAHTDAARAQCAHDVSEFVKAVKAVPLPSVQRYDMN